MHGDGLGERGVPGGPVGVVGEPQVEGRHAGALGAGEALDAGPVGADGDHPRGVLGVPAASSSACSRVPEPDTRTTTRAGTGTSTR